MRFFGLLFTLILTVGCTTFDYEEVLPNYVDLTPQTAPTMHGRINIVANQDSLDFMFANPHLKYFVRAQVDYYNALGILQFSELGKVEIKGAGSANNALKSIGVILDQPIDNQAIQLINPETVYPTHDLRTIQNFRCRNSGQDFGKTMVKDLAYTNVAIQNNVNVELKYGNPIIVFINGAYYGLENVRSEHNPMALSHLLHVDSATITYLKVDHKNGNLEYREGPTQPANLLLNAIDQRDVNAIKTLVDIDNFMDYIIFQDYANNQDWPHNNAHAYSINGGPFRFILFDLDLTALRTKEHVLPKMEYKDDDISKLYQTLFFKDPTFYPALQERQQQLYNSLSPNQFEGEVNRLVGLIETDIQYLAAKYAMPTSSLEWRLSLEQLIRDQQQTDHAKRRKYKIK